MVSLINFKFVNEELRNQHQIRTSNELETVSSDSDGRVAVVVEVSEVCQQQSNEGENARELSQQVRCNSLVNSRETVDVRSSEQNRPYHQGDCHQVQSRPPAPIRVGSDAFGPKNLQVSGANCTPFSRPPQNGKLDKLGASPFGQQSIQYEPASQNDHQNAFMVTWRDLSYVIQPKWHQKIISKGPFAAITNKQRQDEGSTDEASLQHAEPNIQTQPPAAVKKVVLDKLDGSFKSGELTAILGPSGAGKTTLLDCLTGHRKNGLSGSIRISTSGSSTILQQQSLCNGNQDDITTHSRRDKCDKHLALQISEDQSLTGKFAQCQQQHQSNGDNLKVSIIPQNDHLIGHLTVYETLNYASKMKNCFDRNFDHKPNIKRVAQELGLVSCLGTRINKLSGGQYKRVSIAQELLSSPDILILDEPTSGLDAMTCYQTVQVLRKLTDDRRVKGQNQIAVILTIHQPNSDVFQQFNHVYVVAHGGKCIYEGPPTNIESIINRIGLSLPNSFYNPATMIVEIAAGKFESDSINKLNSIQKKQYDFALPDEQNSVGDSAVYCPSTSDDDDNTGDSSSDRDDNDEDDENKFGADKKIGFSNQLKGVHEHREATDGNIIDEKDQVRGDQIEINNNNNSDFENQNIKQPTHLNGLVNKGFVLADEGEDGDEITGNLPRRLQDLNGVVGSTIDSNVFVDVKLSGEGHISNPAKGNRAFATPNSNKSTTNKCHNQKQDRRSRRERVVVDQLASNGIQHKKVGQQIVQNNNDSTANLVMCPGDHGHPHHNQGGGSREKRLKLNSLKADQRFPFWRHTYLHFHRSWISIVRDPMLCGMQLALHIMVPVMVSLVYGTNVGKPNACPRAGPVDIMAYALEPTDSALQLQEDLRTTLENIGYIFFKLYGIIFAAMTVTVLTFPLDMHVLVKEFRNGWYGLSSYFLGRTLADIPFQLTLPLLAMSLSYYATGQPYSYMQWRFLSITAILILSSLIAQSQGLLFGAILMDRMKAAVFVAPAATTPIILFAGFLVRTQSIPRYLRPLSNLSYLRYAIEACLISRYGFNQCDCDPSAFNKTVPELPPIARSMLDYWLGSFRTSSSADVGGESSGLNETGLTTTMSSMDDDDPNRRDLFTKLIESLAKANSFGRNITSCEQVVPYPMIDYDLKDSQLYHCFGVLIFMLIFTRLLTFFIVCFKVKRKV